MYSSIAELDTFVDDPYRLLEDFKVSITADAPTAEEFSDALRAYLRAGTSDKVADEVVEYYATVRSGNIPDRLPEGVRKGYNNSSESAFLAQFLHQYLQQVGCYSKITKHMARGLRQMIPFGSVILDPMTGNGLMVKALREAGIMSFGTDNNSWVKTDSFEPIDALDSLKRYGDKITHLLLAWPSCGPDTDFRLLKEVRKNYENVQIIVIGEINGCTGSEKFWDHAVVLDDLECYETIEHLYDRLYFIE